MKISQQLKAIGVGVSDRSIVGSSLFRRLPNVKHAAVRKHFGNSFASQRKDDYTERHVFYINDNRDWVVTLYMSFGEWRFGAGGFVDDTQYCNNPRFVEALQQVQDILES